MALLKALEKKLISKISPYIFRCLTLHEFELHWPIFILNMVNLINTLVQLFRAFSINSISLLQKSISYIIQHNYIVVVTMREKRTTRQCNDLDIIFNTKMKSIFNSISSLHGEPKFCSWYSPTVDWFELRVSDISANFS